MKTGRPPAACDYYEQEPCSDCENYEICEKGYACIDFISFIHGTDKWLKNGRWRIIDATNPRLPRISLYEEFMKDE